MQRRDGPDRRPAAALAAQFIAFQPQAAAFQQRGQSAAQHAIATCNVVRNWWIETRAVPLTPADLRLDPNVLNPEERAALFPETGPATSEPAAPFGEPRSDNEIAV